LNGRTSLNEKNLSQISGSRRDRREGGLYCIFTRPSTEIGQ